MSQRLRGEEERVRRGESGYQCHTNTRSPANNTSCKQTAESQSGTNTMALLSKQVTTKWLPRVSTVWGPLKAVETRFLLQQLEASKLLKAHKCTPTKKHNWTPGT